MKKLREITKTVVAPKKNVVDDAFQQFGISAGAATLRNRDQGFGHQTNVPGTVGLQHPQTKFGTERPKKKKKDKGFTVIDAEPKYYLAPKRKKPPCISKTAIDLLPVLHEQLKTKQKTITLPEDLVESGTFPNLNASVEQRWQTVKFLVEHLGNIKADERIKMIKAIRTLKKRK